MNNFSLKILLVSFACIFNWENAFSQEITLDSLRQSVLSFLILEKDLEVTTTIQDMPNMFTWDNDGNIKTLSNWDNGIYLIPTTLHGIIHFLIIDDAEFHILNMRDSFSQNLEVLIAFLKKNNYSEYLYRSFVVKFVYIYEQRSLVLKQHSWRKKNKLIIEGDTLRSKEKERLLKILEDLNGQE